jgi:hypothetical protein
MLLKTKTLKVGKTIESAHRLCLWRTSYWSCPTWGDYLKERYVNFGCYFKNNINMKAVLFLFLAVFSGGFLQAQKLGAKKTITVELMNYECGDFCYLEWKDMSTGDSYGLEQVDEKTKGQKYMEDIQKTYYDNGENIASMIGNRYMLMLEYRMYDVYEYFSTDEPPVKTGRKKQWMINQIKKVN